MSVKRSPAARVLEFFTSVPVGEAELVYGLVRNIVRKRKAEGGVAVVPPVVKRRKRVNPCNFTVAQASGKVNAKPIEDTVIVTNPLSLQGS